MKISALKTLIIGASSGIGAELAKQIAGHGAPVVLVARRKDELESIASEINRIAGRILATTIAADVTHFDDAPAVIEQAVEQLGGLDLVIYSSGVMPLLETDEYSFAKDKNIIDVNVTGAVAWLNPVAERFARSRAGIIVGIGSVAGDRGRQGMPVYNSSKAFLETYLEALRNRLTKYGVQVTTIKPGPIETPMTAGLHLPFKPASVQTTATEIIGAIESGAVTIYTPGFWRWIMLPIKLLPSAVMTKLKF